MKFSLLIGDFLAVFSTCYPCVTGSAGKLLGKPTG